MIERSRARYRLAVAVAAAIGLAGVAAVMFSRRSAVAPLERRSSLPRPGTETYEETVSAFYAGVAALDVDAGERARAGLTRATELVPAEPAAWANRGLLSLRQGDFESAERDLKHASALAPESGAVEGLLGLLESRR